MNVRTLAAPLGAVVLTASLLSMGATAQAAPSPGVVLAPPKVKAQILKDTKFYWERPECYAPVLAKSDRKWGLLSPNLAPDSPCRPAWYAIPVVHKVNGKWKKIGLPPNRTCRWIEGVLVDSYKAPSSIIDDFKAARYCT